MTQVSHDRSQPKSRRGFRGLRQNEDGTMVMFGIVVTVGVLLVAGLAVDIMRTETRRIELQGALDRSVLAAADGDQKRSPVQVVNDYMTSSGMVQYLDAPATYDPKFSSRRVSASATMPVNSIMGVLSDPLPVKVASAAQDAVPHVEVSLVLDISGSMYSFGLDADGNQTSTRKISSLKTAAGQFLDTLLTADMKDRVSVSLVPYSEHVNIGPDLFNQINTYHYHNYSHCVEMPDSAFKNAALDNDLRYDQVQHFQFNNYGYYYRYNITETVCPRYDYERIVPWTQSKTQLMGNINKLQPRAGTSIFLGLKWGSALLDPSTRGINTSLVTAKKVEPAMGSRPLDYDAQETKKVIVLMTDGQNDGSFRIRNRYYYSRGWMETWDRYNFGYWANSQYYHPSNYMWQKYNSTLGDSLMSNICKAAKSKGIIIYGVGVEVNSHGRTQMQNCVSSPAHYFDVNGAEMKRAFQSIAVDVLRLRLIQ